MPKSSDLSTMYNLPSLTSFSSPEHAMEYADNMLKLHGSYSSIGQAACVLSNSAYALLKS